MDRPVDRTTRGASEEDDQMISRTRDLISAGVTSAGIVAAVQGLLGGMVFAILPTSR